MINLMRLHSLILVAIVLGGCARHDMELTAPNRVHEVHALFESASVVAVGTALRVDTYSPAIGVRYQMVTFQLGELLKPDDPAHISVMRAFREEAHRQIEGMYLNVIAIDQINVSSLLPPRYELGAQYILYLEPVGPYLYVRNWMDEVEREHPATDSIKARLRRLASCGSAEESKKGESEDGSGIEMP